ncbi:MAG TPA: hypothetical protein VFR18_18750 [Terriglobia bacterium]|nr:hypothetical protein [Terriglobia bacterium]
MANTGRILLQVVDGARKPMMRDILVRVIDGDKQQVLSEFLPGPTIDIKVPTFDNTRDFYTVLASVDGFVQAGFFPVKVAANTLRPVFLMLLPKGGRPKFTRATWSKLKEENPEVLELFMSDAPSEAAAKRRYGSLLKREPNVGAGLWNIVTALGQIHLSTGTALSYMRQLNWDASMQQDRLFGLADSELVEQVEVAAAQGAFAPEVGPGIFHPGATSSFKQLAFGEANVQLTFHEDDDAPNGLVGIEVDLDYFRDQAAHAILEVVPNLFTRGLTDPKRVYVLRWIASRQAGVPDFSPPYTIEA